MSRLSARSAPWLLLLLALAALGRLVPPLQSPDENGHLARASLISRGEWTMDTVPGVGSGGQLDTALVSFIHAYASIVTIAREKVDASRQADIDALRWSGEKVFVPLGGTGYYLPLVYAPHASAMWLGRAFDLSVSDTYQLVRMFCVAACLALLAAAWNRLPFPLLAAALLMLPMTIFQLLSPTLDGVTTCLSVFVLSAFLRLAGDEQEHPFSERVLFAGAVVVLAGSRNHLLPLLALPLYLAWTRRSPRDAWLAAAAIALSAAWLAYALENTVDLRVPRPLTTSDLIRQYLAEPGSFFEVLGATLADSAKAEFYSKSFIGILGWLDLQLLQGTYAALWIGLAVCAAGSALMTCRSHWPARALLGLLAIVSTLLVFFAILVSWTPHPTAVIEGVQGRYFIVPALMLAYAVAAPVKGSSSNRRLAWSLGLLFAALSLGALVEAVARRYS